MRLTTRDKLGVWLMIGATIGMPFALLSEMGITDIPALAIIAFMTIGSALYSITGKD